MGAWGEIDTNRTPDAEATPSSSRRMPGMSSSSGIALVTRKTSATLIVSSWPLAGA